jgi:ESCRT-II complex subunit VPS25
VHILDHLVKSGRAEWLGSAARSGKKNESTGEEGKEAAYIYWLTPEEWSQAVYTYVDETAQKNVVLTVYELIEGEGAEKHEWYGMDGEMFGRCLGVLVKRGKAQVFGSEEEAGVKFF